MRGCVVVGRWLDLLVTRGPAPGEKRCAGVKGRSSQIKGFRQAGRCCGRTGEGRLVGRCWRALMLRRSRTVRLGEWVDPALWVEKGMTLFLRRSHLDLPGGHDTKPCVVVVVALLLGVVVVAAVVGGVQHSD